MLMLSFEQPQEPAMLTIIWEETEGGNAEHIAEHFLSFDDVESVLTAPICQALQSFVESSDVAGLQRGR